MSCPFLPFHYLFMSLFLPYMRYDVYLCPLQALAHQVQVLEANQRALDKDKHAFHQQQISAELEIKSSQRQLESDRWRMSQDASR